MRRSSSKSGVVLATVARGPDASQMLTRAQLGQDPPQRTVLGVLTENGQYRKTCGQVMTRSTWKDAVENDSSVMVVGAFLLKLYLQLSWNITALDLDYKDVDFLRSS